jgi:Excreted virulence factor EspC, type VII ESX diderm
VNRRDGAEITCSHSGGGEGESNPDLLNANEPAVELQPVVAGRVAGMVSQADRSPRAGGLKIVDMSTSLRVDPAQLRAAAAAHANVSAFVSSMGAGQSMATAGTDMSGLLSEGACLFAGTVLDTEASAVHDELTTHAKNLATAADHYHQTDERLGRRLRTFAP